MDFGDILNEWDRRPGRVHASAETGRNDSFSRDGEPEGGRDASARRRSRLLRKAPDAVIDLHNLTQEEAWIQLDSFFRTSREQGFEKLRIIHGKGNHEGSGGVLKEMTRKYIEQCSFAGESGYSFGNSGGSGATWVLLKNRVVR